MQNNARMGRVPDGHSSPFIVGFHAICRRGIDEAFIDELDVE